MVSLHLVPVRSRQAAAFVRQWHRHHAPAQHPVQMQGQVAAERDGGLGLAQGRQDDVRIPYRTPDVLDHLMSPPSSGNRACHTEITASGSTTRNCSHTATSCPACSIRACSAALPYSRAR